MGEMEKENQRETLLREMERLSCAKVNDAVKLAYLTEEQLGLIDKLDLTALAEFKRSGNGAVEVKFHDKMKALEQVLRLSGDSEETQTNTLIAFFRGEEEP